jgi:hypothetical protein
VLNRRRELLKLLRLDGNVIQRNVRKIAAIPQNEFPAVLLQFPAQLDGVRPNLAWRQDDDIEVVLPDHAFFD